MSAFDIQISGSHYKDFAIQPIIFITRNGLDWFQGSIVKYICRHKQKHGVDDVKKVIYYAQMLLEQEYGIITEVTYAEKSTP